MATTDFYFNDLTLEQNEAINSAVNSGRNKDPENAARISLALEKIYALSTRPRSKIMIAQKTAPSYLVSRIWAFKNLRVDELHWILIDSYLTEPELEALLSNVEVKTVSGLTEILTIKHLPLFVLDKLVRNLLQNVGSSVREQVCYHILSNESDYGIQTSRIILKLVRQVYEVDDSVPDSWVKKMLGILNQDL